MKSYCKTCFKACLICLVAALLALFFVTVVGFHHGNFDYMYGDYLKAIQLNNSPVINFFASEGASSDLSQKLINLAQIADTVGTNRSYFQQWQLPSARRRKNGSPPAYLEARKILDRHPFNQLPVNRTIDELSLEEAMLYLSKQPQCEKKPIFTSMAQVGTDLYWQLIENFIFTMVKFSISDCSVMICVTDKHCMDLCKRAGFPCLYYDHGLHNPNEPLPSALEQIAHLKLFHLPKALSLGVSTDMTTKENRSPSFVVPLTSRTYLLLFWCTHQK